MGAPIVTPINQTVAFLAPLAITEFFSVVDPDGDDIVAYRFLDFNDDSTSGHFRVNGSNRANGAQIEVTASQLSSVQYIGAEGVQNEGIRISAFDGTDWSEFVVARAFTVRPNLTRPNVSLTSFSVLANETVNVSNFITASDPDGFPIQRYFIRDRSEDFSFLRLGGTQFTQGQYHFIEADELDSLQYVGRGLGTEQLDVFAFDGAQWSFRRSIGVTTVVNANRPGVDPFSLIAPTNTEIELGANLQFTDPDGNTAKFFRVINTSPHAFAGEILFQGRALDRRQFFTFNWADRFDLTFEGGDRSFEQQVRFQVNDGRFWSNVSAVTIDNIPRPEIGGDNVVVSSHLEEFSISEFFPVTNEGPSIVRYEVVDNTNSNTGGGNLQLNGATLQPGVIHSLTPQQFQNQLEFKAATFGDRRIDEIYVRSGNGTFLSDWKRLEIRTEPEIQRGLLGASGPWQNFIGAGFPTEIPYSFMETFPTYETGEAENLIRFTPEQRLAVRGAFRDIEEVLNVRFVEVSDASFNQLGGQGGVIRLGNYAALSPTAAFSFAPGPDEENGDIWINAVLTSLTDWDKGSAAYATFLRELGPALGLKRGSDGILILPGQQDNQSFSAVSLTPRGDNVQPERFQVYDILQLQNFYGANQTHSSGDNVYSIAATFDGRQQFTEAIWDTGGNDTLSAAGSIRGAIVDIRSGELSSIGNSLNNVGISFGVDIENAIGSVHGDIIQGNHLQNRLEGGGGDDWLTSGAGDDLLLGGAGDDRYVWSIADGDDTIDEQRLGGVDTLSISTERQHSDTGNREVFPGVDSLEDLRFRLNGRDLIVSLTVDGGVSQGSLRINNQIWGSYRIDSLEINGQQVDLVDLTSQASGFDQEFRILNESSFRGNLVVPV